MSNDFSFQKEEYSALRKEVELILADFTQLRIYSVAGVAAVSSWAATQIYPSHTAAWLAWSVAALIPIFGALGAYAKGKHVDRIGEYIKAIEADCIPAGKKAQGWEHFHAAYSKRELTRVDAAFWLTLIIVSTLITIVGGCNARLATPSSGPPSAAIEVKR